jgi:hypothetical protein
MRARSARAGLLVFGLRAFSICAITSQNGAKALAAASRGLIVRWLPFGFLWGQISSFLPALRTLRFQRSAKTTSTKKPGTRKRLRALARSGSSEGCLQNPASTLRACCQCSTGRRTANACTLASPTGGVGFSLGRTVGGNGRWALTSWSWKSRGSSWLCNALGSAECGGWSFNRESRRRNVRIVVLVVRSASGAKVVASRSRTFTCCSGVLRTIAQGLKCGFTDGGGSSRVISRNSPSELPRATRRAVHGTSRCMRLSESRRLRLPWGVGGGTSTANGCSRLRTCTPTAKSPNVNASGGLASIGARRGPRLAIIAGSRGSSRASLRRKSTRGSCAELLTSSSSGTGGLHSNGGWA